MEEFKNEQNHENLENTAGTDTDNAVKLPSDDDELIVSTKSSVKKEVMDWIVSIAIALVVALFIRQYIFTLVKVDGPSMLPTLEHNDMLYVNRFMYTPEAGDIIIFRPPNSPRTPYVKRVIATEGQTVVIDSHKRKVYVDGVELEEDYIKGDLVSAGTMKYPHTVPDNHVFVLGDNRNNSRDSRDVTVGSIPNKNIIGKVLFRLLPVSEFGNVYN